MVSISTLIALFYIPLLIHFLSHDHSDLRSLHAVFFTKLCAVNVTFQSKER
jgi:predicted Na+-dependent transporter